MLKKSITFTDLNGQEVTEDHYFHLSKADVVELELSRKGGMAKWIQSIIDSEDGKAIVTELRNIILNSYGTKSEDGKRFVKNQALRDEFQASEAYSTLFFSLCTDAGAAAEFINGIVPQGLTEEMAQISERQKQPEGHPSDPAAQPQSPLGRNVFEGEARPVDDPTAIEPRLLSRVEVEEMDAAELKAGLATGKYKLS